MAFSDDYTDSESESDESTSVDSEPHSSDLDFLDDESESESENGDSEDDDMELVLENVVSGAVMVVPDVVNPVQELVTQEVEGTQLVTQEVEETQEAEGTQLVTPEVEKTESNQEAVTEIAETLEDTGHIQEPPAKKPRTSLRSTVQSDPSFRTALLNLIQRAI